MIRRRNATVQLFVAVGLVSGCGQDLPVVPVSGTVTLDGQPLADVTVTTQPIAADGTNPGSGSFGKTDAAGKYVLELVRPAIPGAIIGTHRVMFARNSEDHDSGPTDDNDSWSDDPHAHLRRSGRSWPRRFTDGSIQLKVPPQGTATADFDLTTTAP